jgi:BirA family transcriptional regulator, biotin operon repressor / biotin---[acetyl-CoA-carboxylase] ligase
VASEPPFDAARVERESGWTVLHRPRTASTNDDAQAARARGLGPRLLVIADAQEAGRGREGRRFASPPGGLYVSLLLEVAPEHLPAPAVAAVALAAAEAIEQTARVTVSIKWPNDLWIGGRKVGGLLLEGSERFVVAGLGVNLRGVPDDLEPTLRETLTALHVEAGAAVAREDLLVALLARVDARLADLDAPASRGRLASDYAARQALLGRAITWREGGAAHRGRLLRAGLEGLEVEEPGGARRRLKAEHVLEVRPA